MIIKRYIVSNMNEALTRIRYELGKDAVIISQRKIRKPGIKGIFASKDIEVTAAVENTNSANDEAVKSSIEAIKKVVDLGKGSIPAKKTETLPKKENSLYEEMQEMKKMIMDIKNSSKPYEAQDTHNELKQKLTAYDIDEKVASEIIDETNKLSGEESDDDKMKTVISNMICVDEYKSMDGVVVLVGPTGVGKTTTIAKLAGKLALIEKKKVGLITIDTYRIGAVEQLRTYAEIMNLPFKVVITTNDMEAAVESMKDCDVILVDTTGRSSKNTMQLSELRAFMGKVKSDHINLVVSCTTKDSDIETILEGYKILNYNGIIITKLDETSTYGSILNILYKGKVPLVFLTTGQNVPDDVKYMTTEELINLIIGEVNIC